jgi:hypothetical protein
MRLVHTEEVSVRNFVPAPIAALCSAGRKGDSQVEQESDRAAVEVAGIACSFPRTPEGRDQLLRQVRTITTGLDPATVRSPWEHCYGVESTGLWMKAGGDEVVQRNLNVSSKDGLAGRSAGRTGHSTRGKAVGAHLGHIALRTDTSCARPVRRDKMRTCTYTATLCSWRSWCTSTKQDQ